jgi:hypothetical protein
MPKRSVVRRSVLAAGILVVIVLGVIQLGPRQYVAEPTNTPGNTMGDPEANRTELVDQLNAAQVLVGGEWVNVDEPNPKVCTVDGVEGATFTGLRRSTAHADEESLAEVAELWESMGFDTALHDSVGPYTVLVASSPTDPGNVRRFGLQDDRMYVFGQGACGEGNAYSLLDTL